MKNINININECYAALKKYNYYDKTNTALTKRIAEFENSGNILEKLSFIENKIKNCDTKYFIKHIENIEVILYPKAIETSNDDQGVVFNNDAIHNEYKIGRTIPFIDCDISIHLLCVWWTVSIGRNLDKDLSSQCYGNRIVSDLADRLSKDATIFKVYYEQYTKFRDDAIQTSKLLHDNEKNVTIISLDIKSYYNSIKFELELPKTRTGEAWINKIINMIHRQYSKIANKSVPISKTALPIGLLSSNVIGNHYLMDFDRQMMKTVMPSHYARYVDDIIMVLSGDEYDYKGKIDEILEANVIRKFNKSKSANLDASIKFKRSAKSYEISYKNNIMEFQLDKIKVFSFNAKDGIELLNSFSSSIKKSSSEFRYLPDDVVSGANISFNMYKFSYSDSINKLRSIEKFSADKFSASVKLSNLISVFKYTKGIDQKHAEVVSANIRQFIKGWRAIDLSSLWEKSFIVLMLIDRHADAFNLYKHIQEEIRKVKYVGKRTKRTNNSITAQIRIALSNNLQIVFANASAMDHDKIIELFSAGDDRDQIIRLKEGLTCAGMYRYGNTINSFLGRLGRGSAQNDSIIFNPTRLRNYDKTYNEIMESDNFGSGNVGVKYIAVDCDAGSGDNKSRRTKRVLCDNESQVYRVINDNSSNRKKIRIGLVNMTIRVQDSIDSMLGRPKLTVDRLVDIYTIMNSAVAERCDVLIFPEISIPVYWSYVIMEFSRRSNMAVIGGLEHFSSGIGGYAFNLSFVSLPYMLKYRNDVFFHVRNKINYAPAEEEAIVGRGYKIPANNSIKLPVYTWNGVSFAVFNCYEMTDIEKRSWLRGKVDLIVSVEYNKDTNYFSNIVESVSRDDHAYVAQVNSSNYGDSRITMPACTELRDISRCKGGINLNILVSEVDIHALREFQKLGYVLQKDNKTFKPTPPNYVMSDIRKK